MMHIARHGLMPEDVEEVVFQDDKAKVYRRGRSDRDPSHYVYNVYGRTQAGRYILVVLLDEGDRQALPLTARDMTFAERRRHQR